MKLNFIFFIKFCLILNLQGCKVPKSDIKKLVVSYGGYAHGTIKEHGIITNDSINDELSTKEYAIRPTINDECWKKLMEFRVQESKI